MGDGLRALKYLAPYIFRVAISDRRIVKVTSDQVTFRYRATDTGKLRTCKLPAGEFIRRFLQHVLPKGFVKVRYYGFLAPTCRPQLVALRQLLGPLAADDSADFSVANRAELTTEREFCLGSPVLCPSCGRPMHRRRIRPGDQSPHGLSPP